MASSSSKVWPPPPKEKPPTPPDLPPPSMQTSNQGNERLDFGHGDGGNTSSNDLCPGPTLTRSRTAITRRKSLESGGESLEEGEIDEEKVAIKASLLESKRQERNSVKRKRSPDENKSKSAQGSKNLKFSPDSGKAVAMKLQGVGGSVEEIKEVEMSDIMTEPSDFDVGEDEAPGSPLIDNFDASSGNFGVGTSENSFQAEPLSNEFAIIDDLGSDGEEDDDEDDDDEDMDGSFMDSDGNDDGEDDDEEDLSMDEDDIDAMLDEGMQSYRSRGSRKRGRSGVSVSENADTAADDCEFAAPLEKQKVVLVERGHDPFDILPEGWVVVTHNSGMPIFLHKQSRVCTMSRPYFLGPGSARKHDIPMSAIPCLQYQKALSKEQEKGAGDHNNIEGVDAQNDSTANIPNCDAAATPSQAPTLATDHDQSQTGPGMSVGGGDGTTEAEENVKKAEKEAESMNHDGETGVSKVPGVKVETAADHKKLNSLDPMQIRDYCERLFEFKDITVKRFKTWKDRRKHNNQMKKANMMKQSSRPSLPSSTKLITCPIPMDKDSKPNRRKEFVLNPAGKSDVCILHEYVQHAMRVQPRYIFRELENSQNPFSATVVINDHHYGTGYASSKKAAKLESARKTLAILIPEINMLKEGEDATEKKTALKQDQSDLTFFDQIKIEDPRITELCIKAGQPCPYQILFECLKRNYGIGDTQVQMEMKTLKHQKSEFIMKVGKHEARVMCKNKREGKQQAAQAILQKMHPHIHTWGSLLRLYARHNPGKSEEMKSVIDLTMKAKALPNKAILNKLREEMTKLHTKTNALTANVKGRIQVEGMGLYSTELGNVDL